MDSTPNADRQRSAITEPNTAELSEVQFLTFGPGYRVVNGDGSEHIVDVEQETCNCESHREGGAPCEHLRRAKRAISTEELPGPDGRYIG